MDIIWALAVGVVLLFGFVVAFGAPYLPTLAPRTRDALTLLDLKPGQTLLELGCGDGRVLLAAARQGIHGIGYELNPVLVVIARLITWRYRHMVRIRWGNYWRVPLPPADGIYVFLLDRYMSKLDTKITQEQQGSIRLVSYAFAIPGKAIKRQKSGLFLYEYKQPTKAHRQKD